MHRTVRGTIFRPDDTPWPSAKISFQLTPGSFTATTQYPGATQFVDTNSEGKFSISLWTNEEGDKASRYLCRLPSNESFSFTLPAGTESIELSLLRTAGVTPSDPQYPTLVTYVQGLVASQAASSIKVPFSWGDATPKTIVTWQGRIWRAEVVIDMPFNAPGELRLGDAANLERLIPADYISATESARYQVSLNVDYPTPTPVLLSILASEGTTAGSGFVILEV